MHARSQWIETLEERHLLSGEAAEQVPADDVGQGGAAELIQAAATVPAPPENVRAELVDGMALRVTWDPSPGATGYYVWVSTRAIPAYGIQINGTPITGTIYDDVTVAPNRSFYYYVQAVNDAGVSGYSGTWGGYQSPFSDITISAVSAGASSVLSTGDSILVTRTYTVRGAATGANFVNEYRLSRNGVWGDADDIRLTGLEIVPFAGGYMGHHPGALRLKFASARPGTYYLLAKANAAETIPETNNGNNVTVGGRVSVVAPDIARIINDGSAGFRLVGQWGRKVGEGYGGQVRAASGPRRDRAEWTFDGLRPGRYRVFATWTAGEDRAMNAPFTVWDGNRRTGLLHVDQRANPAGRAAAGAKWQSLGIHRVKSGTLTVMLSDQARGRVVADAIRIERIA